MAHILGTTDIAVIGGGHAGVEATLAAARMGCDVILFTMRLEDIANLPCNPSVGGAGKGHIVFEVDALGGEMGVCADIATIQSRTLNLSKGPAVHSKRVQTDRELYQRTMRHTVENTHGLRVYQTEISDLLFEGEGESRRVTGVVTAPGGVWLAKRVIIATGTYLRGRIFIGDYSADAGPDGSLPSRGLFDALVRENITTMRFKTGTPARVRRDTIDFSVLECQPGEEYITPFSEQTCPDQLNSISQMPCHIAYTNATTHSIIRDNMHRSAMFSGDIHGTGPRYCPSIEDKINRFADKERHQLFAEPVGRDSAEIYLQGMSTSMPEDIQVAMLQSVPGFENAQIMRPAYAIEYDCIDPTQLSSSLEFRGLSGLYAAGQFCGTSGYEEAAGLGLVAGVNAVMSLRDNPPLDLRRDNSYIGLMIDDLVTKGTAEPYRMLTSRSEYRLLLRQSSAKFRLYEEGRRVGLLSEERYQARVTLLEQVEGEIRRLEATHLPPSPELTKTFVTLGESPPEQGGSLANLLRRPRIEYNTLAPFDVERPPLPRQATEEAVTRIKYAGYIEKQVSDVKRMQSMERAKLPRDLDYASMDGLRLEARQKLATTRPETLGQASRTPGVNPADVSVLMIYLKK